MIKTILKRYKGLKANKPLHSTSKKTAKRNREWRWICQERADYLIDKYGFIICEYSGETISTLASVPDDFDEGWGHHIDGNRNHCDISNCMIVKFKHHFTIHDKNLKVNQEYFLERRIDNA